MESDYLVQLFEDRMKIFHNKQQRLNEYINKSKLLIDDLENQLKQQQESENHLRDRFTQLYDDIELKYNLELKILNQKYGKK